MPIYEYKCNDCGTVFERLTTSADAAVDIECPSCKSTNATKLISAGTVRSASPGGTPLGLGNAPSAGCGGGGRFS